MWGKGFGDEVTREVDWEQMMQNFACQPEARGPDLSSHQNGSVMFYF